MKKTIVIFLCLLLFLTSASVFCTHAEEISAEEIPLSEAAEATEGEIGARETGDENAWNLDEWKAYAEETLIPIAVFVITSISAVYVAISPILAKVKRASERFQNAADDVNAAKDESRRTTRDVKALEGELKEELQSLKDRAEQYAESVDRIESMLRVAFCNMPELVRNGYAREIAKISPPKEGQDTHEEDES